MGETIFKKKKKNCCFASRCLLLLLLLDPDRWAPWTIRLSHFYVFYSLSLWTSAGRSLIALVLILVVHLFNPLSNSWLLYCSAGGQDKKQEEEEEEEMEEKGYIKYTTRSKGSDRRRIFLCLGVTLDRTDRVSNKNLPHRRCRRRVAVVVPFYLNESLMEKGEQMCVLRLLVFFFLYWFDSKRIKKKRRKEE